MKSWTASFILPLIAREVTSAAMRLVPASRMVCMTLVGNGAGPVSICPSDWAVSSSVFHDVDS